MEILRRIGAFFLDATETIVTSLAIFLMAYIFIARPHQVEGISMVPNFQNGDYVLTDVLSYRFNPPARGEVIVFAAPDSPGDEFIKRIIAVPGDKVVIRKNRVYLNGNLEPDAFLPSDFITSPGRFMPEGREIVIPEGQYFVLGDNRTKSSDSRQWGLVPRKNIVGKAFFRYWPPGSAGRLPEIHF